MSCTVHHAGHLVRFFSSHADRVETVTNFICETLHAGDTSVIVATPEHRDAYRNRLSSMGIECHPLVTSYQYIELDARTLMSEFMIGTECDRARFHKLFDTLIRQASARGQPVRGYGEMCELLVHDGLPDAALVLEDMWNELCRDHPMTRLCGYSASGLAALPDPARTSERIRLRHTHVL